VIVVHGLWRAGRLALWAEDSERPRPATSRDSKAEPAAARSRATTRPHPFAVPATGLAAAIVDAMSQSGEPEPAERQAWLELATAVKLAEPGQVTLRLPTRSGVPVDSPELLRDELPGTEGRALSLAPWLVPTLDLDPDGALAVLRGEPSGLVTPGATLRHLRAVAAFADDLVGRGRLLPVADPAGPRARWSPVLAAADARWAQSLALALPPAGRAAGESAAEVVADALDGLVDASARHALGNVTSLPAREQRPWRAWLAALTGRRRDFAAEATSTVELAEALTGWQRDALAGTVRASFRLLEPAEDPDGESADGWRLEFSLQATDQASLVVPAERVWSAGRGSLRALTRLLDSPQETLLAQLGRASRLYPALDEALREARPAGLDLDGEGAHRFLRDGAPLLAGAGFGVQLPGWWGKPQARLGARLSASTRTAPGTVAGQSAIGLDSIVDYEWQLALGDEPLTAAEMATLTELKTPLVRLRGQWVELDQKRLAAGLKLLTDGGQMTVADLLHTGLSTQDGPGGLPVVSVTADGALGDLLSGQVERRLAPVKTPAGFVGTLRPYQERGLAWLAFLQSLGLGGILADDMGLGKTIQLLALMMNDGPEDRPTLLVCPMSLVGNWARETEKFAPSLRVHVHHGAERARGKEFTSAVKTADLVVTTYAIAARDARSLSEISWHRLVVDEAQAIKNAATRQATAVRALPARHRVAVTGTPVENRLADLWSIMEFANPGLLGTATVFRSRYAEPIERRGDEAAAERLKRLTGPFVLRRVKTDRSVISDLPEKLEMDVLCNLTAEQASLYQAVVTDMMARIEASEGIERRGLVLATMTKLKQVCNHPAHLLRDGSRLAGRSGKLERLEEILDEVLAGNEKALLFTQYAEFGGMLRAHLAARFGREVAFLHGGLSKPARDELVQRFQAADPSSPPLFVLSLKAGGSGLTLTAANHVVHVDRWWNPAVEDQATDRAFRIGQKRNVQVRKFVCAGTVEEKIAAMIRDKRGLAARIVGSSEQWVTEMSTSDLRDLFALENGAVVE
jgi:hypothetical protein